MTTLRQPATQGSGALPRAARQLPLTKVFVAQAALLVLVACGQQPVDLQTMSDDLTASLTQPADIASGDVVDLNAGFAAAVLQAVQTNAGYRAAIALEDETMGRIGTARSARRPQFSTNARIGAINERLDGADDLTRGAAGGINISQLVYDGGESTGAINGATAQALAAQADRRARGNDLALQAARAWIDVWQYGERLRLLQIRTGQMDTLVAQIERMGANGMIDRAAVDSARRQIIDISLEETRLQSDLAAAQTRFQRYYNRPAGSLPQPDSLISAAMVQAAVSDWQLAPNLQRAAAEVLVARSSVTTAESAFGPRARVQAGVTSPMDQASSTDTTIGLVLEYTVGDGGRRQAQLTSARARLDAATAQLADAQMTLQATVQAGATQLASLDRSMPMIAQQISLSATEAETAQSQIATGQSNLRQLIESEIQNYRARDRAIAMQAERHVLTLSIAAQTGVLARELGLDD
jgi:outer membrane protein, adhesin transport system